MFHDFISKEECFHVRNEALPDLEATPYNVAGVRLDYSPNRTSKNKFLKEEEDEKVKSISQRMKYATRMNMKESHFEEGEHIQVQNYPIEKMQKQKNMTILLSGYELWPWWYHKCSCRFQKLERFHFS